MGSLHIPQKVTIDAKSKKARAKHPGSKLSFIKIRRNHLVMMIFFIRAGNPEAFNLTK
jgi:hypothetical protein